MHDNAEFRLLVNKMLDFWGEVDVVHDKTINNILDAKLYLDNKTTKEKYKSTLFNLFLKNNIYSIIESFFTSYYCEDERLNENLEKIITEGINKLEFEDIFETSKEKLIENITDEDLGYMITLYKKFLREILIFIFKEIDIDIDKFDVKKDTIDGVNLGVLFLIGD